MDDTFCHITAFDEIASCGLQLFKAETVFLKESFLFTIKAYCFPTPFVCLAKAYY